MFPRRRHMFPRRSNIPDRSQELSASADDERRLIAAYSELCNRHQQIDDFRGKLLALLPIASGAAILVLLRGYSVAIEKYLLPVDIYGFAITLDLFIYELHGIAVCKRIMEQAEGLERDMNIPKHRGQYRDRNQNVLHRIIEVEMAPWIVYLSVIAGWIYIASVGGGWWHNRSSNVFKGPILIVIVAVAVVLFKWFYAVFLEGRVRRRVRRAEGIGGPYP
jgi:hypothetical protein